MESNVVVNRIEKGNVVNTMTIPSSKNESWKDERFSTLRTFVPRKRDQKETMKKTETSDLKTEKNGLAEIPKDNAQPSTQATLIDRPQSYQEHLETFDLVGSESVKLIDGSAKHLHERMLASETIVEAVMCANQIGKLLKLKLEIRIATRE